MLPFVKWAGGKRPLIKEGALAELARYRFFPKFFPIF